VSVLSIYVYPFFFFPFLLYKIQLKTESGRASTQRSPPPTFPHTIATFMHCNMLVRHRQRLAVSSRAPVHFVFHCVMQLRSLPPPLTSSRPHVPRLASLFLLLLLLSFISHTRTHTGVSMLNTPSAWEAMGDDDARVRVARLRRSCATLQSIYAAFTPWQRLSTGVAELDALLAAAGVGGGDGGNNDEMQGGERIRGGVGATGGLPVGSLHEFYGPPFSGKTFLLHQIATTYMRRMTALRQCCLDELEREQMWLTAPVFDDDGRGGASETDTPLHTDAVDPRAAVSPVVGASTVAVYDWDLIVCVVRGTSALSNRSPSALTLSAEVLSWQAVFMEALPSSPSSPTSGSLYSSWGNGGEGITTASQLHSQHQLQRIYAADHCHVCEVSSPNELLAFLDDLLSRATDEVDAGAHPAVRTTHASSPLCDLPLPQQVQHTRNSPAAQASLDSVRRKRGRSHCSSSCTGDDEGAPAVPSPPALPSFFTSGSKRSWEMQRQRLLLVDGLDQLWLHPSLGTHCGTHAGQLFAVELHRLLRCFLTPQRTPKGPASCRQAGAAPLHDGASSLCSTVVVTNGCHGGSYNLQTPQQLHDRLRGCSTGTATAASALRAAPQERNSGRPPLLSSALPRPAGNPVWLMAVDTRCLVEPAHPSLVSLSSATTSLPPLRSAQHGTASGVPLPSTWRTHKKAAAEAHVTVAQGGSRVCACWVERRESEEDGDDER
jgi:hypothetical protein